MKRDEALKLLQEFVKSESLMKHLLSVEAAMRAYARQHGQDEEQWGVAGLLHDFDWGICPRPEDHPMFGARILRERGVPEELVRAVLTHGDHSGIPRETLMEKSLFAVDELAGFIIAVALVRPSKSLDEVNAQAVRKKMKDKTFARAVRREDITRGAQELGIDLDQHIEFVVQALKPVARELGLNATTATA
ncbi:MAG: HDIG domain-containing protein [Chloroflexi bacterium]|nr:HDIG domain-containing protein [Chloroflexota bacterium]